MFDKQKNCFIFVFDLSHFLLHFYIMRLAIWERNFEKTGNWKL